jgi:hypothetical protein
VSETESGGIRGWRQVVFIPGVDVRRERVDLPCATPHRDETFPTGAPPLDSWHAILPCTVYASESFSVVRLDADKFTDAHHQSGEQ